MALTAKGVTMMENIGQFSGFATGSVDGTGASTTVTIPQFSSIQGVICGGATSTTAVYVATISGNAFTATHANNDDFHWIAWGTPRF